MTPNDNVLEKFNEYRSRVMLGDLPSDFLRLHLLESQIYDPSLAEQELDRNVHFLGYLRFTIAEAKLIKNSGPLGLLRMDPYVRFYLGHITHETPAATGGGKTPQWKVSYQMNLFQGMDRIHIEVFDQRSFTEDIFIGKCDIEIPREVLEGQTHEHWYPLMGREENLTENQGDILIIMSFTPMAAENSVAMVEASFPNSPSISSLSSHSDSTPESTAIYSSEDVQTIEDMFPAIDRQIIINLLDQHGGNKDLVVNHLLQNNN